MVGIYVHLPFCPYICPYCDFAKWPHRRSLAERYFRALLIEIERSEATYAATLFFGGGTPNGYPAAQLAHLTSALRDRFELSRGAEHSIEVNPELVAPGDFERYVDAGVTRVSIGVQSFVPSEIAVLGRRHQPEGIAPVVAGARAAGIHSVSLDLIFGTPGQTVISWTQSLDAAIALDVDHISTYGLTVESGTPFETWQQREPSAFPDDGLEAELYARGMERLGAAGYVQYEISNFARPGHECAHNMNYWRNGEYIGLGVGAASYRSGIRSVHTRNLDEYLRAVEEGRTIPGDAEQLEGARRNGEAMMLALRTSRGVGLREFHERYGIDPLAEYGEVVRRLSDEALVEVVDETMRLTQRGRFVANDVCAAFVVAE